MFVVSNLLSAFAQVVSILLDLYLWVVIIRALVSWVNADPYHPIVRFLHALTDPLLDRIRRALPLDAGGIDFSPIIVIVGIYFLKGFVVRTLYDLALALR